MGSVRIVRLYSGVNVDAVSLTIVVGIAGGLFGFVTKWFIQERRDTYEMRRSIAPMRAKAYMALWPLCDKSVPRNVFEERAAELRAWYREGGGLFLSLEASKRFFGAVTRLETSDLGDAEESAMRSHLTWLRTEMKHHVGSYTRGEKEEQIVAARP